MFTLPVMQCGKHPVGTFKIMEENTSLFKPLLKYENTEISPTVFTEGNGKQKRQSFLEENDKNKTSSVSPKVFASQIVSDTGEPNQDQINGEMSSEKAMKTWLLPKTDFAEESAERRPNTSQMDVNGTENKETVTEPKESISLDNNQEEDHKLNESHQDMGLATKSQQSSTEDSDSEIIKRAQEEGCVNVVFPGTVTQDGCCRFVSEILKCVLYQRQQLPMTYDQLVYSQKKQQALYQDKDKVNRRPVQSADMDWRKCQQTLQGLEEVLQQLEVLFSLSRVPRVLLLMGSLVLPKELYEINMEALVLAAADKCVRVSSCLRQLFRTLFVADLLSDTKPVCLMPTTVLVLAHRDCGAGWFRPKLQFKVPTRVKSKVIALATDLCSVNNQKKEELEWQEYVWFQAPMTIKGFRN